MKANISVPSLILSLVFTCSAVFFSGCSTRSGATMGTIYVDRPEVFTRERLINRRLAEQRWLEDQLKRDAEFSLQGLRDVREFSGFALALKGEFNPLGGVQAESLLGDIKSNARIGELQDELQLEVLRQQLAMVRDGTNALPLMPGQITATNAPTLPTNVTNPLPVASAVINLNSFTTSSLPAVPNPTNRYKSTAQLTSIQALDDKLAYRNAIHARLREQELDDTHDLLGMTLYTLKFDITVAPGNKDSSFGRVDLSFDKASHHLDESDFASWVACLNRELRDESVGLQKRYMQGGLTDSEKIHLLSLAIPRQQRVEPLRNIHRAEVQAHEAVEEVQAFKQILETNIVKLAESLLRPSNLIEKPNTFQKMGSLIQVQNNFIAAETTVSNALSEIKYHLQNVFPGDYEQAAKAMDAASDAKQASEAAIKSLLQQGVEIHTFCWRDEATEADYCITPAGLVQLVKEQVTKNPAAEIRKKESSDLNAEFKSLEGLIKELESGIPGRDGCQGLAFVLRERYQKALEGIVEIPAPTFGLSMDGAELFLLIAQAANPTNFQSFTNILRLFEKSPYVYVVEPKEYAQNISDVAAREKLISYALALSAAIPQIGASVGANTEYLRRSQQYLEAIKREPLVVGFADGDRKFGWLVGPKFLIENGKVQFRHTPIQHSVQATVVVPAWWRSLPLSQETCWLSTNGKPFAKNESISTKIDLPSDYAAITRAFLAKADQSLNKPSLNHDSGSRNRPIVLLEGTDDTILIRGRDLWRNPEVYIGGQRATEVSVLPDMGGLRASFQGIRLPPAEIRESQSVDLTVVTTAGTITSRGGVRIISRTPPRNAIEKSISLKGDFAVLGSNLVFSIDVSKFPKNYGELAVYISDEHQDIRDKFPVSGSDLPKDTEWQIPFKSDYLRRFASQNSQIVWLDLGMRSNPDLRTTPVPILAGGPKKIVLFAKLAESQFKLDTASVTLSPAEAEFKLDLSLATSTELFTNAWPDLMAAIQSGSGRLAFIVNETNFVTVPAQIVLPATFTPLQLKVATNDLNLPKARETNSVALRFLVGSAQIPIANKLTLIRPK